MATGIVQTTFDIATTAAPIFWQRVSYGLSQNSFSSRPLPSPHDSLSVIAAAANIAIVVYSMNYLSSDPLLLNYYSHLDIENNKQNNGTLLLLKIESGRVGLSVFTRVACPRFNCSRAATLFCKINNEY